MRRLTKERIVQDEYGKIKQQVREFTVDSECKYVKIYREGRIAFKNNHSLYYVFNTLVENASMADADTGQCVVKIDEDLKQEIADECGIKVHSLSKYLRTMIDMGAITRKCRGSYAINPFFASRGKECNLEKARNAMLEKKNEEFLKKASDEYAE